MAYYDNRTQGALIKELQSTTSDLLRHIGTLKDTIVYQNKQISNLRAQLKEFDKCKQKCENNIMLITPLSTSTASLQKNMTP